MTEAWTAFWSWLGSLPQSSASFVGSLTGAFFGLIALLIGAFVNAQLNRRRDDRLRAIDRRATAVALKAELRGLDRMLQENAELLEQTTDAVVAREYSIRILPKMIDKLGLFDTITIDHLMEAYVVVEQLPQSLMLLRGLRRDTTSKAQLIFVQQDDAKHAAEMHRQTSRYVRTAITKLDPYTR